MRNRIDPFMDARMADRGALTWRLVLLVLACAVLLLGLVVLLQMAAGRRELPLESDSAAYVTLTAPRGELLDPPREFSWLPYPGAVRYRVKISDEDALWPMFLKTTDRPPVVLDPREASSLTPGRIHVWEVEALGKDGAPIATGGVRFRITPVGAPS